MSDLLHLRLDAIFDPAFQQMLDELYHAVNWSRDDLATPTLFYLLSSIMTEDAKALAANRLPATGVLLTKVDRLHEGAVEDVCRELASIKGAHIESFDGKTVLSLIKTCFPKAVRARKPTRNQLHHDARRMVIVMRRANGDL